MAREAAQAVEAALDRHQDRPGALLPVLQDIQGALGYVPAGAVPDIALALNLSRAEVHGVLSFYRGLREQPPGRHILQICRAESCQALGSRKLEARARELLGIDYDETSPDGAVTLEPVYCLGNCAASPSVRLDDEVHGLVSEAKLEVLIAGLEAEQP